MVIRPLVLISVLGLFAGALRAQQAYKVAISSNMQLKYYIDFSRDDRKIKSFAVARLTGVNNIDSVAVLAYKKVNNVHYVLLWYNYRSHPERSNGQCGAGFEAFVATLRLDSSLKIKDFLPEQTESCWTSFEKDYTFNARHPEHGFKLTPKY